MFKKLTFAEPKKLKLGWWGGQITTRCMFLFKKPKLMLCHLPLEVCHDSSWYFYFKIFYMLRLNQFISTEMKQISHFIIVSVAYVVWQYFHLCAAYSACQAIHPYEKV